MLVQKLLQGPSPFVSEGPRILQDSFWARDPSTTGQSLFHPEGLVREWINMDQIERHL